MINMTKSLVFLNCDLGIEPIIYSKMSNISNVSEAVRGSGLYNRVANVTNEEPRKACSKVSKRDFSNYHHQLRSDNDSI